MVLGVEILGIQVVGLLFGLAMIYFTYVYFRKREIGLNSFALWVIVWLGVVSGVLFPNVVSSLLRPLVVVRVLDLYIVIAILVLLGITFYNFHLLIKMQNNVKKMVRKLALEES